MTYDKDRNYLFFQKTKISIYKWVCGKLIFVYIINFYSNEKVQISCAHNFNTMGK